MVLDGGDGGEGERKKGGGGGRGIVGGCVEEGYVYSYG